MVASPAVTCLSGVGVQSEARLAALGIFSVFDLLCHWPYRYEDLTTCSRIDALFEGQHAVVVGDVVRSHWRGKQKRHLWCEISDGTERLVLCFFNPKPHLQKLIVPGRTIQCSGRVRFRGAEREMVHPHWRVLQPGQPPQLDQTLRAIYPLTSGLKQFQLQQLIQRVLDDASQHPLWFAEKERMPPYLLDALQYIHRPPSDADVPSLLARTHPAYQHVIKEELLAHHLAMLQLRTQLDERKAPCCTQEEELTSSFIKQLPFSLTKAQARICKEVSQDLTQARPMLRLIQGDVGSGKTVIAALAALQAIAAGLQVVVMTPIELLAEQHYETFTQWFEPLGVRVALLAGKIKGKARAACLDALAQGQISLLVGTQAVFQQEVVYQKLGLVVIDEQHRFGVEQRAALTQKGEEDGHVPHQLVMTATPIPRTLAMAYYADLSVSTLDERPAGRQPIKTVVIGRERQDEVILRVNEACREGRQAYWVCPLIEDNQESSEGHASAEAVYAQVTTRFPHLRCALVHGRTKTTEKEERMRAFSCGDIDLLVATTVIEVGVNVPNATIMVIENAERFGLSQLHQLRGRVGRGEAQSYCVLLYDSSLSPAGHERLKTLRETTDGFVISEKDMALRGPGELLGVRQTGAMQFKVADLLRDQCFFQEIQKNAHTVSSSSEAILARWLAEDGRHARV